MPQPDSPPPHIFWELSLWLQHVGGHQFPAGGGRGSG